MLRAKDGKEALALEKFKSKVQELNQPEETLLRFLRARDHNLEKAEIMIRKAISWRKETNIESYLLWEPSKQLLNDFIFRFTGYDYEGKPVVYIPWGLYDGRAWVEKGQKQELINLMYHNLELTMKHIQESNYKQVVSIFDMEHLSIRKMAHLETLQMVYTSCQEMENYYPEIINEVYVINTPRIFSIGFNFIKPMISAHTLGKMHIFNSNKEKFLKALLEKMPKDALPKEYLDAL